MGGLFQEVNNVSSFIPELLIKLMSLSPASEGICLRKSSVFFLFFFSGTGCSVNVLNLPVWPFELSQKETSFSDADDGFPET